MQRDTADHGAPASDFRPPGMVLREARERRGMTVEAVSSETRIPASSIHRIEEGAYGDLPAQVFVRGFLRAYARAVAIDPDEVIRLFEAEHGPSRPPKASRWPGLFRMRRRSRLGLLVAILLFLGAVALLLAFVYR